MKVESLLSSRAAGLLPRSGYVKPLSQAGEISRLARPTGSTQERVSLLVQRAVPYLQSDPQAALRCLYCAVALLASDVQSSGESEEILNRLGRHRRVRWQERRTLAYIEENLGSKVGIRDLAALLSLSKSHFSRTFKRNLGLPPMRYVARRGLERAKIMMISMNERLTTIAFACGFSDQSHLNRSFRRTEGMNPGRWRRTNLGGGRARLLRQQSALRAPSPDAFGVGELG
jgi:AraC family transcriptional regulator